MSAVLACRGLQKQFGSRTAVDDVSFTVDDGECYGLLGPNGAGKTTTIAMVCGLLQPDQGEVTVDGKPGGSLEAKAVIGYVPQELALYPDLSARENLHFFGQLYALSGRRLEQRIDETLALVGLADRGRDRVGTYSGGMKRRANIAAGLLHQPRLLILDEPTVGVDPQSRHAILETVAGLGIAVLYTTHYMEEAATLCHRIGIIDDGRLVAEGTPAGLIATHGGNDRLRLTFGAGPRGQGVLQVPVDVRQRPTEKDKAEGELDFHSEGEAEGEVESIVPARSAVGVLSGEIDRFAAACLLLPPVSDVRPIEGGLELTTDHGAAVLPLVVREAGRCGVELTGIEVLAPNLESVFLALTGKELRD